MSTEFSHKFRLLGPRKVLRELKVPLELSRSWDLIRLGQPFGELDVFGIGWIDTDSDRFLEWNIYASTSEPPVRPGSHPYVTSSVTLVFDRLQRRLRSEWFSPEVRGGVYQVLVRDVPADLQRKWRTDLERPVPSLPVEVVPERDFEHLVGRS